MQIGWQYNDEYYYTDDNDSGTPQKVYFDKKKAEEAALDMNIKSLKQDGLTGYYESLSDALLIDEDDFRTMLEGMGGSVDDYEITMPDKLKREDAIKVLAAVKIRWFEVADVPVAH